MVKLIIGTKGTGKTKILLGLVNSATEKSKGAVICIEKGAKLNYDVTYRARLIDTDEFAIQDAQSLYGFITGIVASNRDITDIYVDSALKICGDDVASFTAFVEEVDAISGKLGFDCTMTSSIDFKACPDSLKDKVINMQ
ncbi:MAG: hypothetical protein IJW71_02775 [Clostridia bacterium]|nr:hypothetical protein [Clostridia bacterium]